MYFIKICCNEKIHRFGEIVGEGYTSSQTVNNQQFDNPIQHKEVVPAIAQMKLNEFGIVAYNEWIKLPQRFPSVELDIFQIMYLPTSKATITSSDLCLGAKKKYL